MDRFEKIIAWVLRQEDSTLSGKVVKIDEEGRTRFGIAELSHPNLPQDFYTKAPVLALIDAERIYKNEYWDRMLLDKVNSDEVASCLMSFGINNGVGREVLMLQKCLGVVQDGIIGPLILAKINSYDSTMLASLLRAMQESWYRHVVMKDPTKTQFLAGWVLRARRVYPNLD